MGRNIKFSKIIAKGENPGGVTVQSVNGTEHWPTGGWNEQAFGSTPMDWSPERWERDAANAIDNDGPGVLYTGKAPEFGFGKYPGGRRK
jgi:hypothetical protein